VRRFGGLLLGLDGEAVKRLVWHWVGNATFQISWHMRFVDNLSYVKSTIRRRAHFITSDPPGTAVQRF